MQASSATQSASYCMEHAPLPERFDTFVAQLEPLELAMRCDLAGECLHYWDFERTGSGPVVMGSRPRHRFSATGDNPGVRFAWRDSRAHLLEGGRSGRIRQWTWVRRLVSNTAVAGLLGTDVYLACVYVVYLYTVTRMRMTKEFNKVIPQFPELTRRLLGTYKMEV